MTGIQNSPSHSYHIIGWVDTVQMVIQEQVQLVEYICQYNKPNVFGVHF